MTQDAANGSVQLHLTISGDKLGNVDDEVVASLAEDLRELIPSADVSRNQTAVPASAKSAVAFAIGQLIIGLTSGGMLTKLVSALQSWAQRQHRHSISLELDGDKIEIHGPSSSEQAHLISAWLSRHTAKP
jgi:Effector Associated Constant Component 1